MYARSAICKVSRTLWSVMSTPMPLAFRSAMRFWISITDLGSTPAKGSSRSMILGLVTRARAISQRRRSPPDRLMPRVRRTLSRWKSAISFSHRATCSSLGMGWSSARAMRFSHTVRPRNTLDSWGR